MADIDPDVPDRPILVNQTPAAEQTASVTRDALLIVAAIPALIAVFGTRDVNKIVAYVGSVEFAPVLGVLVSLGVIGWRQWLARRRHADLTLIETKVPDSVVTKK